MIDYKPLYIVIEQLSMAYHWSFVLYDVIFYKLLHNMQTLNLACSATKVPVWLFSYIFAVVVFHQLAQVVLPLPELAAREHGTLCMAFSSITCCQTFASSKIADVELPDMAFLKHLTGWVYNVQHSVASSGEKCLFSFGTDVILAPQILKTPLIIHTGSYTAGFIADTIANSLC